MHSNYAFYFGATPTNTDQLAQLKNVEGCCGVKLFAGSSTGNLLVDKEADIEKVISRNCQVSSSKKFINSLREILNHKSIWIS